jgi:hypothetical protein
LFRIASREAFRHIRKRRLRQGWHEDDCSSRICRRQ